MKKLMFAISLAGLLGLGASAEVTSANTFGVLKVESSQAQTIIAVPWIKVGTGTESIKASDLVMTSNLTKGSDVAGTGGDTLYYYDSKNKVYRAWVLNNAGDWVATTSVTLQGVTVGDAAENQPVARGAALILNRQNPTTVQDQQTVGVPIYLYGQYTNAAVGQQSMQAGAFNLIAPPNTSSTPLNLNGSGVTWVDVNVNDQIKVSLPNGKFVTLIRNNDEWGLYSKGTWSTALSQIQPGTGAWYVAAEGSTAKVTFN